MVQLTASAEVDTYNPQIYVIEENTVTVSAAALPRASASATGSVLSGHPEVARWNSKILVFTTGSVW